MSAPSSRFYRPGEFLFREGDPSRSMFILNKGSVSIRRAKGSEYIELSRLYSGEILGELSFFDKMPRSAAAVALTEVEVAEIPFEAIDKIYEGAPPYFKTIVSSIAGRLRKANDMIRRIQKDTAAAAGASSIIKEDEPSLADILAATADIAVPMGALPPGAKADAKKKD